MKQITCPRCGQRSAFSPDNKWRPFCSERCKLIDLGEWASETYRVAGKDAKPVPDAPDES